MHKLNRPISPNCLANYRHGAQNWGHVTSADKSEIWQALEQMQGKLCAYCECDIAEPKQHIEHFVQRSKQAQQTFMWSNLFGSCNREESCGKHKDRQAYQANDLIKPDIEDPEYFLVFAANGSVSARASLSAPEKHRADETIRVFNLNGSLTHIRFSHIQGYIQTVEEFVEMSEHFTEDEWLPMLEEEIDNTSHLPFATAIKHVLTNQG